MRDLQLIYPMSWRPAFYGRGLLDRLRVSVAPIYLMLALAYRVGR